MKTPTTPRRNFLRKAALAGTGAALMIHPYGMYSKPSAANAMKLVTYPAPNGYPKAKRYNVKVNGRNLDIYDARIDDPDNCAYTGFDFEEYVEVVITIPEGFSSFKIRPQSAGVKARVQGNNTIAFELTKPVKLMLELNDSIDYPLFLFASPVETNPPQPDDPNVRYFGPGIHETGHIRLRSNETVYVAGGAIVKCYFTAEDATNIRITGRGIMDAHENNTSMIRMIRCQNVLVDGITIADQPAWRWTSSYWACDNVVVNNIKILAGDHYSNDGIAIVSCQDFTVRDCFIKCYDDCVVVKAHRTERRPARNILISSCLIWNIQAHSVQIGPELDAPEVCNVLVENCDLIYPQHTETDTNDRSYFYTGALGIMDGDDCDVHNIRFENIRIEKPTAKLISLKIMKTQWNRKEITSYGKIRDVHFKDIYVVDGETVPSEIISFGSDQFYNGNEVKSGQLIENITIENLNILGKEIKSAQAGGFIVCPASNNLRFI
jgi:hypothetical protein